MTAIGRKAIPRENAINGALGHPSPSWPSSMARVEALFEPCAMAVVGLTMRDIREDPDGKQPAPVPNHVTGEGDLLALRQTCFSRRSCTLQLYRNVRAPHLGLLFTDFGSAKTSSEPWANVLSGRWSGPAAGMPSWTG